MQLIFKSEDKGELCYWNEDTNEFVVRKNGRSFFLGKDEVERDSPDPMMRVMAGFIDGVSLANNASPL